MDYLFHILIFFCITLILTASLDLIVGETGLLSLAHAAFYGLGAYSSALLAVRMGAPFLVGILVGMAGSALISFFVSLPSLRLHDDYFVIATFAFQMILFSIFNNWIALTGGPLGIPGIPPPSIFGWAIRSSISLLALAVAFAVFAYFVVGMLASSPLGRVLRGIREDEAFAKY